MPKTIRVALLACFALLGGCAGEQYSAHNSPRVVTHVRVATNTSNLQPVFSPVAADVLFRALGLVGTPYRWGGNTPDSGFDCSGLIKYVYGDVANIALPRTTREMIVMGAPDVSIDALQSGDLVFFATHGGSQVSHAGIYVGEGRFVHAPSTGGTVRLDDINKPYWQKAYLNAKRVIQVSNLAGNP